MQHDWIKSTLGHGETMCRRCAITNREAAVLGLTDHCDKAPEEPKPANENWAPDPLDEEVFLNSEEDDEGDLDDEMGEMMCSLDRSGQCGQAGSEHCEFECPYRNERA